MKTSQFFDLGVTAPVRLARMRKAVSEHAAKYPNCPEHAKPKTWRDVRRTTFKGLHDYLVGLSQGSGQWYCHTGEQFRHEKDAADWLDAYRRRYFPGYYTDTDLLETATGIVARLTHGRFIAGYHWSDNGERVYFPRVFTDVDDAAQFADSEAEWFAEKCRENAEKYDEARNLENDIEEKTQRLRECLALRHRACMAYVRDEIAELCEQLREMRERMASDFADYA